MILTSVSQPPYGYHFCHFDKANEGQWRAFLALLIDGSSRQIGPQGQAPHRRRWGAGGTLHLVCFGGFVKIWKGSIMAGLPQGVSPSFGGPALELSFLRATGSVLRT